MIGSSKMKTWTYLVIVLYILLVAILIIPSLFPLADLIAGKPDWCDFSATTKMISSWEGWILIAILVVFQTLLLFYPIGQIKEPPKPQRSIWVTVLLSVVLFTLLLFAISACITAAIKGDRIDDKVMLIWLPAFVVCSWVAWAIVFYKFGKSTDHAGFASNIYVWLIRGSVVEMLVAIPSHIIVRHRNDCCAPGITFAGLAVGMAVMGLVFGPAIFFLFAARLKRMVGTRTDKDELYGYIRKAFLSKFTLIALLLGLIAIISAINVPRKAPASQTVSAKDANSQSSKEAK
jgi:hypothetical protein